MCRRCSSCADHDRVMVSTIGPPSLRVRPNPGAIGLGPSQVSQRNAHDPDDLDFSPTVEDAIDDFDVGECE